MDEFHRIRTHFLGFLLPSPLKALHTFMVSTASQKDKRVAFKVLQELHTTDHFLVCSINKFRSLVGFNPKLGIISIFYLFSV